MLSIVAVALLAQSCDSPFVCTSGDQLIDGSKVFTGLVQAYGDYGSGHLSLIVIRGAEFGGPIQSVYDGDSLSFIGRRHAGDSAPDFLLYGGLAVWSRNMCGQVYVVDPETGNVTFGSALVKDAYGNCTQAINVLHTGMLVMGNGASGAIALQSAPEGYISTECRIAERHSKLPDGGDPNPADYASGVVASAPDGGTETWFNNAALHGCLNPISSVPMRQGLLFTATNTESAYGPNIIKFGVHASGAYGSMSGITRAQFPTCPAPLIMMDNGQNYPGVGPGMQLYASDTKHVYVCLEEGWFPVPTGLDLLRAGLSPDGGF